MHYLKRMEKITDKDSELYFIMAKGYALQGDKERAEVFFLKALTYYPSSSYYVYKASHYLFSEGEQGKAEGLIRAFDRYVDRFRTPHNPRGFYVYKIRDLEAAIAHERGDTKKALSIARTNYDDANKGVFVITTARSRAYVERKEYINYLKSKVQFYESALSGRYPN
jgi:tetratricopeptide (TPR) repeat protein